VDREARAQVLVSIARAAIAARERPAQAAAWSEPWLRAPGATFVTLRLEGALRGCIGSIEPRRPLGDDVAHNAHAAAYRDFRFDPVTPAEMPRLGIEVSVLSPREPLAAASEAELIAHVRPGVDGLYLEYRGMSSTFLPQVWESLADPRDFLAELKRKAGLPPTFWDPEMRLSRYTVEKYA
jgi:AmmeMemoRadiSam system protein A